jgi:hypothetical protein
MINRRSYGWLFMTAAVLIGLSLFYIWNDERRSRSGHSETSSYSSASTEPIRPVATLGKNDRPGTTIPPPDTTAIPPHYQLPGVARVRTADSFDAWMDKFPPDDRKRIEAFADRYYGVYEIASAKQIAWMAQTGYPMPEDLIAAAKMSDTELKDLAAKGNIKATILLSDRELNVAIDKLKQIDPATPEASDIRSSNFASLASILNSNTPFKGYVEAADAMYLGQDGDARAGGIAAGLIRAASLGDTRAADVLSDYSDAGIISERDFVVASKVYVDLGSEQIRLRSLENCPLTKTIPQN